MPAAHWVFVFGIIQEQLGGGEGGEGGEGGDGGEGGEGGDGDGGGDWQADMQMGFTLPWGAPAAWVLK